MPLTPRSQIYVLNFCSREMLDNETLQNYYDNYIQKQRRHPSQSGWTVSPFSQEDVERMRENIEDIKRQLFESFYEEEE